MYARFYRWAFDRLQDNGIVAFITNRSFIDSRTFDGFRHIIQTEFDFAYIIDTQSDVRVNPKIAGTTHNVFGIQTGVAIMFLVKKADRIKKSLCSIFYSSLSDEWRKETKLQWFTENEIKSISFNHIQPDKKNNWLNIADNDFEGLLPLVNKKSNKSIFLNSSNGISTNRDEWVYDYSKESLGSKISFFAKIYNRCVDSNSFTKYANTIKWSRDLKNKLGRKIKLSKDQVVLTSCNYRPFTKKILAMHPVLNDVVSLNSKFFSKSNKAICINGSGADGRVLSINTYPDLHFTGDTKCFPLYQIDGESVTDNISDWALNQFTKHYKVKSITKEQIFNYIYAVLHNPLYRTKYELNLKRELPRIPFYEDFHKWSLWGKNLMDLHLNYEKVDPFDLKLITTDHKDNPKARLKANKQTGTIIIDENTQLVGIPVDAWQYMLGNRCALEWVLDQFKESKPKDPTISERFNNYRFADYKEYTIDLLRRVCTVSMETRQIINNMV